MYKSLLMTIACLLPLCFSCQQPVDITNTGAAWRQQLDRELPLLGHRNWILVVDKAFPLQTSAGIEVINTNDNLIPVLQYTLKRINESTHVKPILYTDKEINYITESESPGIGAYKSRLKDVLGKAGVQSLLHDSVFVRMDAASKLFKVLVLKTNETFAYSSVFIQLDCAYWNAGKETQLREAMKNDAK